MFPQEFPINAASQSILTGELATRKLADYPRRIICLTEETTEALYLLGQQERIVGVSGYTMRPPEARRKPRVSAFILRQVALRSSVHGQAL